jgi:NitT/TauT family transport system ATP-binding protein
MGSHELFTPTAPPGPGTPEAPPGAAGLAARKPLLEMRGVSKSFDSGTQRLLVLEGVDLRVEENEFVCVVGPSGCGKTTLLKMVTGLEPPDRGSILYKGRPVTGVNLDTALIFQSYSLLPWLDVRDNVELPLEARGVPLEERRRRAAVFIDKVGLDGYEEAYPRELSAGMKQRAVLARAFATEPELLCMDEPFSGLDVLTAASLREEVVQLWQDESMPLNAVLMVTHMIEEAVLLADRVLVLSSRPGRVVSEVRIDLERPRNRRDEKFSEYADQIFSLIV